MTRKCDLPAFVFRKGAPIGPVYLVVCTVLFRYAKVNVRPCSKIQGPTYIYLASRCAFDDSHNAVMRARSRERDYKGCRAVMLKTTWYSKQRKYFLLKVFQIDTTAQGLMQAIAKEAKTMLRVRQTRRRSCCLMRLILPPGWLN